MNFKIQNKLRFSISDYENPLTNFIRDEYSFCKYDGAKNCKLENKFHIEIIEDKISENSVKIRNPIILDNQGLAITDFSGSLARIDFENLGTSPYQITCDKDFDQYFFASLLEYIIYLEFVHLGYSFCHASSFVFEGKTILCPAWRNVGKTNLLLSFLKDGAQYLSDDWILINRKGSLLSLPKRINLLYYNYLPNIDLINSFNPELSAFAEKVLKIIHKKEFNYTGLSNNQLKKLLKKRFHFEEVFNKKKLIRSDNVDYIFHLYSNFNSNNTSINVKNLKPQNLLQSVLRVLRFEQMPFKASYDFHKFLSGKENLFVKSARIDSENILFNAFQEIKNIFSINIPDQNQTEIIKKKIIETIC